MFAVTLTALPEISSQYPLERLKADLWDHISTQVFKQEHQIEKLRDSPEERNSEIVDI